jgi:hypothetical protein
VLRVLYSLHVPIHPLISMSTPPTPPTYSTTHLTYSTTPLTYSTTPLTYSTTPLTFSRNEDYCKGGFAWALKSQNYKNCVTNQQGVLVASKLAVLLPTDAVCACKAKVSKLAVLLLTDAVCACKAKVSKL